MDRGKKSSNKVTNHGKTSLEMEDIYRLPDFDDDNDDEDYQPHLRKQERKRAIILDDDDDDNKEHDEEDNSGNGDDNNDDDYDDDEENDEDEDDEEDDNDEDEDEKITLQQGKAREQKRKTAMARAKAVTDQVLIMEEMPHRQGYCCANVEKASEFRKYIKNVVKIFAVHVKRGKQIKKYLLEMI